MSNQTTRNDQPSLAASIGKAFATGFCLLATVIMIIVVFEAYTDPAANAASASSRPIYMCADDGMLPCVYSEPDMGSPTNYQMTHSYLVHKSGVVTVISHKRAHRLFTHGR